jgi:hypothetical protein
MINNQTIIPKIKITKIEEKKPQTQKRIGFEQPNTRTDTKKDIIPLRKVIENLDLFKFYGFEKDGIKVIKNLEGEVIAKTKGNTWQYTTFLNQYLQRTGKAVPKLQTVDMIMLDRFADSVLQNLKKVPKIHQPNTEKATDTRLETLVNNCMYQRRQKKYGKEEKFVCPSQYGVSYFAKRYGEPKTHFLVYADINNQLHLIRKLANNTIIYEDLYSKGSVIASKKNGIWQWIPIMSNLRKIKLKRHKNMEQALANNNDDILTRILFQERPLIP